MKAAAREIDRPSASLPDKTALLNVQPVIRRQPPVHAAAVRPVSGAHPGPERFGDGLLRHRNLHAARGATGSDARAAAVAGIHVNDDGEVKIMAANKELLEAAKARVLECTAEAEIGKIYRGKVVSIRDFGAFVEILPGLEGLLHISEMADYRVRQVTDICKEGDYVTVKVVDIDQAGKIRLSRKAALEDLDKEEAKK